MEDLGIAPGALVDQAEAWRRDGQTVMFVAIDGQPAGLLGVADPIKAARPRRCATCTPWACASSC